MTRCGRSRVDHLTDRRRLRQDRALAALALLVLALAVAQSRTVAVGVGALLAYCLAMAVLWRLARTVGHARAVRVRARRRPPAEPTSNVHVLDRG